MPMWFGQEIQTVLRRGDCELNWLSERGEMSPACNVVGLTQMSKCFAVIRLQTLSEHETDAIATPTWLGVLRWFRANLHDRAR